MVEEKIIKLLDLLVLTGKPMTSESLSVTMNMSEKTILKYINELKSLLTDSGASLEVKQGAGSYIRITDPDKFREFYAETKRQDENGFLNDPELRKTYVLSKLLVTEEYINVYDLADELYISPSLLRQTIKSLLPTIKEYGLILDHSHNHGYKIAGDEKSIRRCLTKECRDSSYLSEVFNKTKMGESSANQITEIISDSLNQFDISLSKDSIHALSLHIVIAINRVETANTIVLDDFKMIKSLRSSPEYFVASYINKQLYDLYHVDLPENELIYLTMHINGKQRLYDHNRPEAEYPEEVIIFYNKFLRRIYQVTHVDLFADSDLRAGLLNHFVPFLNRISNRMQINKTELIDCKNEFTYAYELSLIGMTILTDQGIKVTVAEITYIALHIALSLEKEKENASKYNILVICNEYSNLYHLLSYKLTKRFEENIRSLKFVSGSELDHISYSKYDLILNTSNFPIYSDVLCVNISSAVDSEDENEIRNGLKKLRSSDEFKNLFKNNLFFKLDVSSKDEVLKELIRRINEVIPLPDDFYENVLKREKIESTEFNNRLAFPHAFESVDSENFIAVAVLKKPILWDTKNVQIVFLSNINRSNTVNNLYSISMRKILKDSSLSSNLVKAENMEEFLEMLS